MRTSRFSPQGGAVRGLVIVLGCLAVVWLCAIAGMSAERQIGEIRAFLGASVVALLLALLALAFRTKPQAKPVKQTFWLSPNGGEEITGPFTVGQIVAMWKAGQITTQGMAAKEGTDQWVPILAVAEAFDDSLIQEQAPEQTSYPLARSGGCLVLLGLVLLLFVPAVGGLLFIIGLVLWAVGSSSS